MTRHKSPGLVVFAALSFVCLAGASMAPKALAEDCLPPPEGLVSLWSADGHAEDLTGRNPGQIDGAVDFVAGEVGEAFQFGGAGSVVIPASASLSGEMAGITLAAWVKPQFRDRSRLPEKSGDPICTTASILPGSLNVWSLVVQMNPDSTSFWGAVGRSLPLGAIQFVAGKCDGSLLECDRIAVVSEEPVPDDGEFHFIAGTYDGLTLRIYLDGNLVGERANAGPVDLPLTDYWIGSIPPPVSDFGLAAIDEAAVFNRALSAEEIRAIVLAGTAGICRNENEEQGFRRGDADGNGTVNLTDAVRILNILFLGLGTITCDDAADSDDTGAVDLTDAIRILNVLFLGLGTIPAPGADTCGLDRSADGIECAGYTASCQG